MIIATIAHFTQPNFLSETGLRKHQSERTIFLGQFQLTSSDFLSELLCCDQNRRSPTVGLSL